MLRPVNRTDHTNSAGQVRCLVLCRQVYRKLNLRHVCLQVATPEEAVMFTTTFTDMRQSINCTYLLDEHTITELFHLLNHFAYC